MSSPPSLTNALCYEFSRSLEQSFAWSPPDLSMSSKTCSSIVALSPSEIAHLGLNRFESESAPSNLFLARQTSSERDHMSQQRKTATRNDTWTSCVPSSRSSGRIDELENHHYATRPSDLGIKRYSMDQAMRFRSSGNLQLDDARQHLPPSTDSNLFSGPSSSSILYSSTSREFSSQSSDNMRNLVYGERTRTGDGSRQYDASHKQASSGDNRTLRDPIRDRHRRRSYPGLANEDIPSALDFHINTFPPLLALDSSAGVIGPQDNRTCFLHPYPSDIQLLPSSSTSETFSPLVSLSDRTDIHRQLIYFPSPTFSLSRFPSSLSSPAVGSSEISGDAIAAFPSNWDAEDIIVDMIPISDECESTPAYETADIGSVQKERFAERIAKLGGKFKRALLNRIRSLKTQSTRKDNHSIHYRSSVSESSALGPPPGLTGQFSSDLAKPLEPSNRQSMTVQETSSSQMFPLSERSSQVNPPKSVRKRFSLSIFSRPSSIVIPNEPKERRQVRPKSMPDLLNQYPTGSSLVESYDSNKQRPLKVRSKQSKKLSLLFLRNRS